ncbi:homeobox protein [Klebsormidium nitens]|uniref:Homeobox protein n=1 Tax=Klebsormidium nitens TaxID=105231 RepID=A0A0U9HK51_KLENI|nr:homeobox protein [Klebsormidium nitens]|eukprot:GAQ83676.1 homeobox protein [Klebsormidium nitens]
MAHNSDLGLTEGFPGSQDGTEVSLQQQDWYEAWNAEPGFESRKAAPEITPEQANGNARTFLVTEEGQVEGADRHVRLKEAGPDLHPPEEGLRADEEEVDESVQEEVIKDKYWMQAPQDEDESARAPTPVDLGFPFPPSLKLDLVRILTRAKAATDHAMLIKTGSFSHEGLASQTAPLEPALRGSAPTTAGPPAQRNGRKKRNTKKERGQKIPVNETKRKRAGEGVEKNGRRGRRFPVVTCKPGVKPKTMVLPPEMPSDRAFQNGSGHFATVDPSWELYRRQPVRAEFPRSTPDLPVLSLGGMLEDAAGAERAYTALDDIFKEAELRELVEQVTGGGNRGQGRPRGLSEGFGVSREGFGVSRGSFSAEIRAAQAGEGFTEEFPSSETPGSGEDTVENVAAGALEMAPRAVRDFVTQALYGQHSQPEEEDLDATPSTRPVLEGAPSAAEAPQGAPVHFPPKSSPRQPIATSEAADASPRTAVAPQRPTSERAHRGAGIDGGAESMDPVQEMHLRMPRDFLSLANDVYAMERRGSSTFPSTRLARAPQHALITPQPVHFSEWFPENPQPFRPEHYQNLQTPRAAFQPPRQKLQPRRAANRQAPNLYEEAPNFIRRQARAGPDADDGFENQFGASVAYAQEEDRFYGQEAIVAAARARALERHARNWALWYDPETDRPTGRQNGSRTSPAGRTAATEWDARGGGQSPGVRGPRASRPGSRGIFAEDDVHMNDRLQEEQFRAAETNQRCPVERFSDPAYVSRTATTAEALLGLSLDLLTEEGRPHAAAAALSFDPYQTPGSYPNSGGAGGAQGFGGESRGLEVWQTRHGLAPAFQSLGGAAADRGLGRLEIAFSEEANERARAVPWYPGAAGEALGGRPREEGMVRRVQRVVTPVPNPFPPRQGPIRPTPSVFTPGRGNQTRPLSPESEWSRGAFPLDLQGALAAAARWLPEGAFPPERLGGTWTSTPTVLTPAESWAGGWLNQEESAFSPVVSQEGSHEYVGWGPGQPWDATWQAQVNEGPVSEEDEPLILRCRSTDTGSKRKRDAPAHERRTRGRQGSTGASKRRESKERDKQQVECGHNQQEASKGAKKKRERKGGGRQAVSSKRGRTGAEFGSADEPPLADGGARDTESAQGLEALLQSEGPSFLPPDFLTDLDGLDANLEVRLGRVIMATPEVGLNLPVEEGRPENARAAGGVKRRKAPRGEHSAQDTRGSSRQRETRGGDGRALAPGVLAVLNAWFHDHFKNPYPTDEEKAELAAQCNLQVKQINNWFGNKRMRLKRTIMQTLETRVPPGASVSAAEHRSGAPPTLPRPTPLPTPTPERGAQSPPAEALELSRVRRGSGSRSSGKRTRWDGDRSPIRHALRSPESGGDPAAYSMFEALLESVRLGDLAQGRPQEAPEAVEGLHDPTEARTPTGDEEHWAAAERSGHVSGVFRRNLTAEAVAMRDAETETAWGGFSEAVPALEEEMETEAERRAEADGAVEVPPLDCQDGVPSQERNETLQRMQSQKEAMERAYESCFGAASGGLEVSVVDAPTSEAPGASAAPPPQCDPPLAAETDTQEDRNEEAGPQHSTSPEPGDTWHEAPPGDARVAEPESGAEPRTPEGSAGCPPEAEGAMVSRESPQTTRSAQTPEEQGITEANVATPAAERTVFESLESFFQ